MQNANGIFNVLKSIYKLVTPKNSLALILVMDTINKRMLNFKTAKAHVEYLNDRGLM